MRLAKVGGPMARLEPATEHGLLARHCHAMRIPGLSEHCAEYAGMELWWYAVAISVGQSDHQTPHRPASSP